MDLTAWAMPWIAALFFVGVILLLGGGNAMVHGSSRLAKILGIHPIIVGLTIVALGTSMPEFLVSMIAALKNKPDLALGNIIGSNVSNLGLILGLSALARPIAVHPKLLKFEVPLLVGVSMWLQLSIMASAALAGPRRPDFFQHTSVVTVQLRVTVTVQGPPYGFP